MMTKKVSMKFAGLALAVLAGCTATSTPDDNIGDNDLDAVEVVVGANFIAATRAGTTTGVSDESICEGFYPATPNHTLQIDASLGMKVSAVGANGEDVRLWAQAGQSNFCGEGTTSSEIARFWTRGTIDIYVGTTSNGFPAEYELTFTPN
ncbi:MAG: hypothetical protein H6817_08055 [Phycisphaerales bacterium]|nr:hypothetical protein [Phycisphaerales bacterium]